MSHLEAMGATCRAAQLPWRDEWLPHLQALATCVAQGQQQTNLVGDASEAGVAEHVIEALTVAAAYMDLRQEPPRRVVDIGAGAGLEALTLAIAWPLAEVVAVEPRIKRAQFIAATASALALGHLRVVQKTLHSAQLPPHFDLATARAVWPPAEWAAKGLQVVARGGLVAIHTRGVAAAGAGAVQQAVATPPQARVCVARAVPGDRGHVIALVGPTAR